MAKADLFIAVGGQVVALVRSCQVSQQAGVRRPFFDHLRRLVRHNHVLVAALAEAFFVDVLDAVDLGRTVGPLQQAIDQHDHQRGTALGAHLLLVRQLVDQIFSRNVLVQKPTPLSTTPLLFA